MKSIKQKTNELFRQKNYDEAYQIVFDAVKTNNFDTDILKIALSWAIQACKYSDVERCVAELSESSFSTAQECDHFIGLFLKLPSLKMARMVKRFKINRFGRTETDVYELAVFEYRLKNFPAAEALFRELCDTAPQNPLYMACLAELAGGKGEFSEAIEKYKELLDAEPLSGAAVYAISLIKKFTTSDSVFESQCQHIIEKATNKEDRCYGQYALSKYYSDLKKEELAWEFLYQANEQQRRDVPFDDVAFEKQIQAIEKCFVNSKLPTIEQEYSPIFIVGMPRSGTTLMEQFLSQYEVFPIGESNALLLALGQVLKGRSYPDDIDKLVQADLTKMSDIFKYYINNNFELLESTTRVVDKLPGNFLYVGIILAVFPNSRIINMTRDFTDCAVSIYSKYFKDNMPFTSSARSIESFYKGYIKLANMWAREYPERFLTVNYESLVGDFVAETKRVAEFINVEWTSEGCDFQQSNNIVQTPSIYQVRQGINSNAVNKIGVIKDKFLEQLK